ncbi:MAG: hypothetical protein JXQ73_23470, partial [Phycisphaerae bacterium]|nr:hypothetical protein [Phycisphaerae bacterium]
RPDLNQGCVLFFRRPDSAILMSEVELYNIDPDATYEASLTAETYTPGPWKKMKGRQLQKPEITIRNRPGSALLRYKRAPISK